jgi:hypothetical protein
MFVCVMFVLMHSLTQDRRREMMTMSRIHCMYASPTVQHLGGGVYVMGL